MLKIQTAVLSVSDKTGIVDFAKFLQDTGVKIISTGGTGKLLQENGINIVPISAVTKNEEDDYFDGRMKTISFQYESALLYKRDNPEHIKQAEELGIPKIDLVVCNLYPFEKVTSAADVTVDTAVENIDIGGPCMVRAAAKNYEGVAVVVNPQKYPEIMDEMKQTGGSLSIDTRQRLAAEAYERTADYDAAISIFFAQRFLGDKQKRLKFMNGIQLGRYAENWHQKGWLYKQPGVKEPTVPHARQVMGGALGYNNYLDGEAALASALEFYDVPAVSIIKHANPCGLATGATLVEAFERAWEGDPVSAFGSVIAVTRPLDMPTAAILAERFVEVLLAPAVPDDVLDFLKERKTALRILEYPEPGIDRQPTVLRGVLGGLLEQERDDKYYLTDSAEQLFKGARELECANSGKRLRVGIVTRRKISLSRAGLLNFALRHVKYVKSNAISIAREYETGKYQILGMGCGQPNRKDSVALAGQRAQDNLRREFFAHTIGTGTREEYTLKLEKEDRKTLRKYLGEEKKYVRRQLRSKEVLLVSDAFFPFRDGLDNAAATMVRQVVQPGGSVRDDEVIAAADEHKIAMIFTGVRKFYH
ncbi:MAG: bifunctional phosphoribosylaminoimidazolecarboxamide formyltransferase/IMP cyclohydrolase [bacterium]